MTLINNRITKLAALTVLCATFSACDHDIDDDDSYNSGTVDFSKFVSLGDSLTAGYADGALSLFGQENSFPNILAQQFAQVGGGDFIQPLMNDDLGGLLINGIEQPEFENRLILNGLTNSPEPIEGTPTTEVHSLLSGAFNNMGVPGAKSFHMLAANYGNPAGLFTDSEGILSEAALANPYFSRFVSTDAASMVEDAASQQPSFFTLWAGNNDTLSYATTGGTGADQTGNDDLSSYGSNDITDPAAFAGAYQLLVDAMTSSGGKGVLINLPDISAIPFFTTVPYNAISLTQEEADALNSAFIPYNEGVLAVAALSLITEEEAERRIIAFSSGQNAIVISDESLTDLTFINPDLSSMRQATADDLILLPASSTIGTADENDPTLIYGLSDPLVDGDVLIPSEILAIDTARQAYNATIKSFADESEDLVLMDAAALLDSLPDGIDYGTGYVDGTYATGGAFSLDGVHLTARGYAIIANEIMISIENGFGANLPAVDPGTFTTIFIK